MPQAAARLAPDSATLPALILFGLDEGKKPHASTFTEDLADKAMAAAETMGMAALKLDSDTVRAIAEKLPAGKIFDSGKAFVPFVKASTYDAIVAQLPEGTEPPKPRPPTAKAQKPGVPPATYAKLPDGTTVEPATDWAKLTVGNLVLASEGKGEGWFECVVVALGERDTFWLKWQDWPELDNIVRHRSNIGLLPAPASGATSP